MGEKSAVTVRHVQVQARGKYRKTGTDTHSTLRLKARHQMPQEFPATATLGQNPSFMPVIPRQVPCRISHTCTTKTLPSSSKSSKVSCLRFHLTVKGWIKLGNFDHQGTFCRESQAFLRVPPENTDGNPTGSIVGMVDLESLKCACPDPARTDLELKYQDRPAWMSFVQNQRAQLPVELACKQFVKT